MVLRRRLVPEIGFSIRFANLLGGRVPSPFALSVSCLDIFRSQLAAACLLIVPWGVGSGSIALILEIIG